jgi:hypothetical protein
MNRQFARFWRRRDPFFRETPAELDRRADRELALGRGLIAEKLSHAAAAMREVAR